MRKRKLATIALLALGAFCCTLHGRAQSAARESSAKPRPELAITYTALMSNAPPGDCGCFTLSGGGAAFAWPFAGKGGFWYAVGDFAAAHNGSISAKDFSLTLSTYTVGLRWEPPAEFHRLRPYAQALLGAGHASGSLVSSRNYAFSNAGAAFASDFGSGMDLRIHPRMRLRLAEVGYQLTTFENGSNAHQNNLRIGSGLVVEF